MLFQNSFLSLVAAVALVAAAPASKILKAPDGAQPIPDNWIVVMKDGLSDESFLSFLTGRDPNVISATKSTFNIGSFKGFSGVFSSSLVDIIASTLDVSILNCLEV